MEDVKEKQEELKRSAMREKEQLMTK